MIPIATVGSTAAFRADVDGAVASPLRLERFAAMVPGDRRQLVWLTSAEPPGSTAPTRPTPIGSSRMCAQFAEGLYAYDPAGASTLPALADRLRPERRADRLDVHAALGRQVPRRGDVRRQMTSS